tara:strand:- start:221 stop:427 length:207 start_codon:yes stop_codon:yes gene_type:complete
MDFLKNFFYKDYNKDRYFVNIFLIPKIENKICELESITKDKTEYSFDINEAIKSKKLILLSLRYYYNI